MRTRIGCLAVLASVMGRAAEAAAMRENYEGVPGKRGLSLRFPEVSPQEEWGSVPMLSLWGHNTSAGVTLTPGDEWMRSRARAATVNSNAANDEAINAWRIAA